MNRPSQISDNDAHRIWRQIALSFLPEGKECHVVGTLAGGFSQAVVVEIQTAEDRYVLRGTPGEDTDAASLAKLHRWMHELRKDGLPVAAPLWHQQSGQTSFYLRNRHWQLEPKLPGIPVTGESITDQQLENAIRTLAQMHQSASDCRLDDFRMRNGRVPSVLSRRQLIRKWTPERLVQAEQSLLNAPSLLREKLHSVLAGFLLLSHRIDQELAGLEDQVVPLHWCFRDLWNAHLLFTGGQVTGVIDPHAAREDHISTDLSRLLGSLFGDDTARWEQALRYYEKYRKLTAVDHQLIRAMDRSSVLLSGMTWLSRWMNGEISSERVDDVVKRLLPLEQRIQRQLSTQRQISTLDGI